MRILREHLYESLKPRVLNVPIPPGQDQDHDVRVAVLFSGGLDCTVLARMVHDLIPSDQEIDLLNVAFENPRSINAAKNAANQRKPKNHAVLTNPKKPALVDNQDAPASLSHYELCPDRATGRKAFQELQNVCPKRAWRFVAVCLFLFMRIVALLTTSRSTCHTRTQSLTEQKLSA